MSTFASARRTIRANLRELIKKHPSVKNDYRKLVQYYWYYVDGMHNFVPMNILEGLSQPESISREFRRMVEDGEVKPGPKVSRSRAEEEERYREHYGKT